MESFLNRLYGFNPEKSKSEGRKYSRYPISLRTLCHFDTSEDPCSGMLVDICDQGLGFELDGSYDLQHGQQLVLAIEHPVLKDPVEAIVRLQWMWVKIPSEGSPRQRVGSSLVYMDPLERAQLLHYAHTLIHVGVDKNTFALNAMAIRFPKLR